MERQMSHVGDLKQTISQTHVQVAKLDDDVTHMKRQMSDYDKSINTYSDLCDNIVKTSAEYNSKVNYLMKKVDQIDFRQKEVVTQQMKGDDRLVELQWRSMRDNLIFTDI